jgi:hypothetical protein
MPYDYDYDRHDFYYPGGLSALRAGKHEFPCPDCKRPDRLTATDVELHYRCDYCADVAEGRIADAENY